MVEEKDDQKALDVILAKLKSTSRHINLRNILIGIKQSKTRGEEPYKDIDLDQASEVLQNLFLDGWFSQDIDQLENWLILTSYGRSQLEMDYHPVFLDPTSTIQDIKGSIPSIDSVALDYFQEALWAIKKRLYLSATVTMGCASEQSILLLIEAVLNHYGDDTLRQEFDKLGSIKNKFELLMKSIKQKNLKNELLENYKQDTEKCEDIKRLFIDIDTLLNQMFSIYRINRNDAGHPTGRKFTEEIVKANAAMFKKYCEIVYGLILYL